MQTVKSDKNNTIYLLKFIGAIFVMLIHTPFFSDILTLKWQFDAFLRLAIPFFAICNGYFLAKKNTLGNNQINVKRIVNQVLKLFYMYLVWTIIYLFVLIPQWIETGWFSIIAFIDWGISIITTGSYFHLWYLLYLIYALLILMILFRFVPVKKYPIFIVTLYLIEAMQYGYRKFLPGSLDVIVNVFDKLPCLSAVTRILPFVLLGIYISKKKVESISKNILKFGGCFGLLIVERNFLASNSQASVSFIIFTLPTIYYFGLIVFNVKLQYISNVDLSILGKMSIYIYLIHPFVNEIVSIFGMKLALIRFVISACMSIIGAYLLACRKIKCDRRIEECE